MASGDRCLRAATSISNRLRRRVALLRAVLLRGAGKGGGANPGQAGGPPLVAGTPPPAQAKGKAKGVIIDPEDAKVPYTPAARAKSDDIIANRMFLEPELHCFPVGCAAQHVGAVQFADRAYQ